jgi:anti-sigma-K factor RskA
VSDRHDLGPGAEPHDLAAPYALDALSDREREDFETHLSACPACRAEVADLREAAVALSDGLELAPSAELRRRVLDEASAEPRPAEALPGRPSRRGWWVAAAAAVVIGAGTWTATQLLDAQDPTSRIVEAADAQEFDAAEGDVTVIASAQQDAAVLRLPADLEPAPQGKVYQAWYVGADGSARSAGLLTAEVIEDGETVLEGDVEGAAAVGLTVEPEGGSDQPTSEPFTVVPLG